MFGFFSRKKNDEDPLLGLSDADFVDAVKEILLEQDPAGWLMCLIGVNFLSRMLQVFRRKLEVDKSLRKTVMREMVDVEYWMRDRRKKIKDFKDEHDPAALRAFWVYLAAAVIRAGQRAGDDSASQRALAEIWACLIKGCKYIPGALPRNTLWRKDEKEPFLSCPSGSIAAMCVVAMSCFPKEIRHSKEIEDAIVEASNN